VECQEFMGEKLKSGTSNLQFTELNEGRWGNDGSDPAIIYFRMGVLSIAFHT
jgi:hypothetical protein